MASLNRHALVRRREAPHSTTRAPWPRHGSRSETVPLPQENQIVRGLMVGVPLGLALWLMLALIVWWLV